jgi:hypothetical protein
MLEIINSAHHQPDGPPCGVCGAKTRLFGIESHPVVTQSCLLSFVCIACDAIRVDVAALPNVRWQFPHPRQEAAVPMTQLLANGAFDPETTNLLGAAFEDAWLSLRDTGSSLTDETQAASTREMLAKTIIESAQQGERDGHKLVEKALASLAAFTV